LTTLPQQVVEPFHTLNLKSACLHPLTAGEVRSLNSMFLARPNHHNHLSTFHLWELFNLPQFQ
jgi:hypothetical protein